MWFGVTLVGHLIDVPRQEVTPPLIVNQSDGMVLCPQVRQKWRAYRRTPSGRPGANCWESRIDEPLARCFKRRERASCPGQKLV